MDGGSDSEADETPNFIVCHLKRKAWLYASMRIAVLFIVFAGEEAHEQVETVAGGKRNS